MTEPAIAAALLAATTWETAVRAHWHASAEGPDREAARDLLRHTVQYRKAIERFVGTRIVRAHQTATATATT